MALLGSNVLTILDWAKTRDPDGKTAQIAEFLNQVNPVLDDMMFKESNQAMSHLTSVRTGLPSVAWRLINQGVQPSKSTVAQVTEGIGMLEAWSEVDEALAELNGDVGAFRMSESAPFVEAMSQTAATTVFYGNSSVSPEQFTGLSVRYSSLSAPNAKNIIDAGGTGSDNTSIWLIVWGDNAVHGLFPKGTNAGLTHEDFGKVTVETTAGIAGNRMRAYQERWKWNIGLSVKDWRCAVRIANIDVSDLNTQQVAAADLTNKMIRAVHHLGPQINSGRPVFYMNRTATQMLDINRLNAVQHGGGLTFDNVDGRQIATFRGIPVKTTDAILETESRVV